MSQSHIRTVHPLPEPKKAGAHVAILISILVVVVAAALWFTTWDRPHEPYISTEGTVSETRIVVADIVNGTRGGGIKYRLEAHVNYDAGGGFQDHWLAASEQTYDREMLESQLADHPRYCLVYWSEGHPETAWCRLHK